MKGNREAPPRPAGEQSFTTGKYPPPPPPMRIGDCGDTMGVDGIRRKPDGSIGKTKSSGPALLAIVIFVFCAGIACGWQMHGGGL